jgi:hypothetical protein
MRRKANEERLFQLKNASFPYRRFPHMIGFLHLFGVRKMHKKVGGIWNWNHLCLLSQTNIQALMIKSLRKVGKGNGATCSWLLLNWRIPVYILSFPNISTSIPPYWDWMGTTNCWFNCNEWK